MRYPFLAAALLLAVGAVALRAEADSPRMSSAPANFVETGAPPFVVLGPEALGLSLAPTDLQLLPDGRVLAVAQREIALGDGVRWETFRAAPEQEAIFAQVAVDGQGQIYFGIAGGIARVDLGIDGQWRTNRVSALPANSQIDTSTMISVATVGDDWYWHSGSGAVVEWHPGSAPRITGNVSSIERIFRLGPDLFISSQSSGALLRVVQGGAATERVSGAQQLASETVTSAIPFGPGELLVGTSFAGLKVFNGKDFRTFTAGSLLGHHRINDLCDLGNGYFAAAIDTVGIVFFDRAGRTVQTLERSLDHRLARALRLRYASNGVLWCLLNEGVARIEFPAPISHFEPLLASGLSFARPVRHDGRLWMLADGRAMQGVYSDVGRLERFEEAAPPGRYVFTLADQDGDLFASTNTGTYLRTAEGWTTVDPKMQNARVGIGRTTPRGIPYAARDEIGFLRKTAHGFAVDRLSVPGLTENYRAVQDEAGIVWLELGTSRVARIDLAPDVPTVKVFGPAEGLTDGWVEVYIFEGRARFHLPNHLFRYDDRAGRFVEDRELLARIPQLLFADGRPVQEASGRLWYSTNGSAHLLDLSSAASVRQPKSLPIGFAPSSYTVEENGVVWMFLKQRLVRFDPTMPKPPASALHALITSVQFPATSRHLFEVGGTLAPIEYSDNSLLVHFAAPANPFASPVTFEVMLEGAANQWVSTGNVGSAAYNRLKEGSYVFHVRPVTAAGIIGDEAQLSFIVQPPWYRTPLAWFIYVLASVGLIAFAAWLSAFLQRRENERLERVVARRTEELNATNAQLGLQIEQTTEKSAALAASEERYRALNTELEHRVAERTAELSHSNQELQQRESLFRLIFEHAPVGISWKRADLADVYHFNPTYRRIIGLPTDTLADYTLLSSLVHPDDAAQQARMNGLIGSGEIDSYNVEERFVLADGRQVWGSLSVAVIRDASGRIIQDIGILEDITARKRAEDQLATTYKNLVEASRMAGMAEVATGVLHNVGNVLNSLNVSSNLILANVRQSKADSLARLSALVNEHAGNLAEYLANDPKGKLVPELLSKLAQHSVSERDWLLHEVASMQKNIDHIKEIVAMQQSYATVIGLVETLDASTLFEDALRMNTAALARHDVRVEREFLPVPPVAVEKGKVLQILINVIRNAKYACDDVQKSGAREKIIVVRTERTANDRVRLSVRDNGIGIPPENLTRIFAHGFTTRAYGHGFGLHSSAVAAQEMKGSLTAHSAGPGQGATFILELPIAPLAGDSARPEAAGAAARGPAAPAG